MKKILSQGRKEAAIAPASRQSNESNTEKSAKVLFFVCAAFSIVAVFTIVFYLLYVSIPVFREVGLFNFLFKRIWAGSHWADGLLPPEDAFGIFPAIVSSVVVTAGAVLIGGFLGVCAAIFMVHYCPKKIKGIYVQLINLLAGIPSIIYGFVGLQVLVPLLQKISGAQSGMGPLAAVLVLSMMILPTVASISKNSIEAIPKEYYEGALAMGNTKAQAVFKVCVPAARKGIFSSLILGVGRAVGETMAVQMVIGNSLNWLPGAFSGRVHAHDAHRFRNALFRGLVESGAACGRLHIALLHPAHQCGIGTHAEGEKRRRFALFQKTERTDGGEKDTL